MVGHDRGRQALGVVTMGIRRIDDRRAPEADALSPRLGECRLDGSGGPVTRGPGSQVVVGQDGVHDAIAHAVDDGLEVIGEA